MGKCYQKVVQYFLTRSQWKVTPELSLCELKHKSSLSAQDAAALMAVSCSHHIHRDLCVCSVKNWSPYLSYKGTDQFIVLLKSQCWGWALGQTGGKADPSCSIHLFWYFYCLPDQQQWCRTLQTNIFLLPLNLFPAQIKLFARVFWFTDLDYFDLCRSHVEIIF